MEAALSGLVSRAWPRLFEWGARDGSTRGASWPLRSTSGDGVDGEA